MLDSHYDNRFFVKAIVVPWDHGFFSCITLQQELILLLTALLI
jgi:hypothetical protein